jgi:hypothetical protein
MMASQQQSSTASAFLSSEGGGGGGYGQHRFSDGGARAGGCGSGAAPLPSLPGGNANASIIAILESKLAQASHQLEAATSIKETTDFVVLLKETALAIDQCSDRRWRRSTSDFVDLTQSHLHALLFCTSNYSNNRNIIMSSPVSFLLVMFYSV